MTNFVASEFLIETPIITAHSSELLAYFVYTLLYTFPARFGCEKGQDFHSVTMPEVAARVAFV